MLFVLHYNFLSISYRLKVIKHFRFRWDFPVWGKILAVLGAGDPQNMNFGNHFPKKARVSTEPRRLMHNTSLAKVASDLWPARGEKRGRRKSQKFDKRPSRGGATAQPTPKFFSPIECAPRRGQWSPLPNLILIG